MAATDTTIEQPTTQQAPPDPATRTPAEIFRFSSWVHLGPGASSCEAIDENAMSNECSDPLHFHAWCRLPNQFQHREIREKGMAAKARKTRQLRDPECDAHLILEGELDDLVAAGDSARETVIDELLQRNWWKEYVQAVKDVTDADADEADDAPYRHIEQDRLRLAELRAMDDDQVPADELAALERHVGAYFEAVQKRHQERLEPERTALGEKENDELIELVRRERIAAAADEEFMHVYSTWEWLLGTLRAPHGERIFRDMASLMASAPEVIELLQVTYNDLERTVQEVGSGN
jgi:hypothetical protein